MGTVRDKDDALFDPAVPDAARVQDYLLGGRDNFAADREIATALEAADPPRRAAPGVLPSRGIRARARDKQEFFPAAARRAAADGGVAQFLVLDCGLHAVPAVHDAAREVIPAARAAYADADPLAASRMRAATAHTTGVAVAGADPASPKAVLADQAVRAVIDPAEPTGVILGGTAQFLDAGQVRGLAAAWMSRMAPGSWLIMASSWYADAALRDRVRAALPWPGFRNHSPAEFATFFGGLDLVPPGVTVARRWVRRGWPDGDLPGQAAVLLLAAAGVVRR